MARAQALSSQQKQLQDYMIRLKQKHDTDLRELQRTQREEITQMMEDHNDRREQMSRGFDIQISEEAEQMAERLDRVRLENNKRIKDEKARGEADAERLRALNQEQLQKARDEANNKLLQIKEELEQSSKMLVRQAHRTTKKYRTQEG